MRRWEWSERMLTCRRAHLAGARVIVPLAIARHREEIGDHQIGASKTLNRERHRLRAVLSNYGPFHSFRVIPQAFMWSLIQALSGIVSGPSRFRPFSVHGHGTLHDLDHFSNAGEKSDCCAKSRFANPFYTDQDCPIAPLHINGNQLLRTGTTRSRFGLFLDEYGMAPQEFR